MSISQLLNCNFKENFFALSPDIIGVLGLDGYFNYVSPAISTVLGYSAEEFIARPLMSFVHPEDLKIFSDEYHLYLGGKNEFSIAARCRHKNGSFRHILWKVNANRKEKMACTIGQDITDFFRTKRELKNFLDLARDFMCVLSVQGYLLQVNSSFEKELGYSIEELTSFPLAHFIHPDDIALTLTELEKLNQGMISLHFENRFRNKRGQYRILNWKAYPFLDEGHIYATARDVTELRKARSDLEIKVQERTEELLKSRAFSNSLIENMPNMVFVKEAKDLTFIRFNKAGEDLLGYKSDELFGKNDYDFFTKEQANFFTSQDRKVLAGKSIVNIPEEEITTRYKGTRILHSKKIPIYDLNGKPEYLLGISEDITEIKIAERERIRLLQRKAILEERERISKREAFLADISNILSSSLDFRKTLSDLAVFLIPKIADWGTIIIRNEEGIFERMATVSSDENLKLKELFDNYPPDPKTDVFFESVMNEKKSIFLPKVTPEILRERFSNEKQRNLINSLGCYSSIVVPLTSRDKTIGIMTLNSSRPEKTFNQEDFILAEDIGKRIGVVVENSLLYAAAKIAIKSRDDFISIASHELKTPITSLKLQFQMAKRGINSETGKTLNAEKLLKLLDTSNQQIDRLTSLVEDLLDVTRMESGKIKYHFELIDICELVKNMVERFRNHFLEEGITISSKIVEPTFIQGDPYRLEQVIINLLTNASKYGNKKPIQVEVKDAKDHVIIKVIDHGIGIETNMLKKVFERFERAVSHQNISGLGLGLYISKEIVIAHKGTIEAQSDKEHGTCFTVTLPKNPKNENPT